MEERYPSPEEVRSAEVVREACVRAALEAFEDASMRGLCCAGAWECAVGAMQSLDLEDLLRKRNGRTERPG